MTSTKTRTVKMDTDDLDRIAELLEITGSLLRVNPARVDPELDRVLIHRGITGGPCWFIDMVDLAAFALRAAASTPTGGDHHE